MTSDVLLGENPFRDKRNFVYQHKGMNRDEWRILSCSLYAHSLIIIIIIISCSGFLGFRLSDQVPYTVIKFKVCSLWLNLLHFPFPLFFSSTSKYIHVSFLIYTSAKGSDKYTSIHAGTRAPSYFLSLGKCVQNPTHGIE